jgi:hypothetical protein
MRVCGCAWEREGVQGDWEREGPTERDSQGDGETGRDRDSISTSVCERDRGTRKGERERHREGARERENVGDGACANERATGSECQLDR